MESSWFDIFTELCITLVVVRSLWTDYYLENDHNINMSMYFLSFSILLWLWQQTDECLFQLELGPSWYNELALWQSGRGRDRWSFNSSFLKCKRAEWYSIRTWSDLCKIVTMIFFNSIVWHRNHKNIWCRHDDDAKTILAIHSRRTVNESVDGWISIT